uniref:ARAD1D36806p n=1 Tax=Blastobotrys adeninivorans TaxID=409370 RepID=A0A060TCK6_BLAAD
MKKMFTKKNKELTPEQQRELMEENGLPVHHGKSSYRQPKFSQFSNHAQRLAQRNAPQFGPTEGGGNPYAQQQPANGGGNGNPYAQAPPPGGNPYASTGGGRGGNPYAASASASPDPYGAPRSDLYASPPAAVGAGNGGYSSAPPSYRSSPSAASPYAAAESSYNSRFGNQSNQLQRTQTTDTFDNKREELFKGAKKAEGGIPGRSTMASRPLTADDELMETPEDVDRAAGAAAGAAAGGAVSEQVEMDSEDEDVEAIKGQIRFTKQQSVNSTRNALRAAAEAEESGRNTLGMLGAQGERLANTEQSLSVADVQNRIAEEKARELRTLNRSMFAVHMSNPFSAKRRLQEKEERIKEQHRMEQAEREGRRQMAYESTQRVTQGLRGPKSDTAKKYRTQASVTERAKYQFENDSEDDEMEDEIEANLDGISSATARLKRLAMTTNEEITRQNERLDNIAENTDNLDLNVHLNTQRLADIK